jgi:hypothetical protein
MAPDLRFTAADRNRTNLGTEKLAAGPVHKITGPEAGSDLTPILKRKPTPGVIPASPIPILQTGLKAHEFAYPVHNPSLQQGYGDVGNFIRDVIFQYGLPMLGIPGFGTPDFKRTYSSLSNPQSYKIKNPNF